MTHHSDIAGLSERLNDAEGVGACLSGDPQFIKALCKEAATALDSLSARVKELEAERDQALDMLGDVPGETLHDRLNHYIGCYMGLQATVARAEQQRDEAYELLKPFAKYADSDMFKLIHENAPENLYVMRRADGIGNITTITVGEFRSAATAIRRLASGPEGGSVEMEGGVEQ